MEAAVFKFCCDKCLQVRDQAAASQAEAPSAVDPAVLVSPETTPDTSSSDVSAPSSPDGSGDVQLQEAPTRLLSNGAH